MSGKVRKQVCCQVHSPEYANMELEDFLARMENYTAVYQVITAPAFYPFLFLTKERKKS